MSEIEELDGVVKLVFGGKLRPIKSDDPVPEYIPPPDDDDD